MENSRRGYLQYLVQGVRWIESKVTGKGMGLGTGMQVTVAGLGLIEHGDLRIGRVV